MAVTTRLEPRDAGIVSSGVSTTLAKGKSNSELARLGFAIIRSQSATTFSADGNFFSAALSFFNTKAPSSNIANRSGKLTVDSYRVIPDRDAF